MITITPDGFGIPLSVPSEHGLLHGQLALLPDAPGLVVLAHAAAGRIEVAHDVVALDSVANAWADQAAGRSGRRVVVRP